MSVSHPRFFTLTRNAVPRNFETLPFKSKEIQPIIPNIKTHFIIFDFYRIYAIRYQGKMKVGMTIISHSGKIINMRDKQSDH